MLGNRTLSHVEIILRAQDALRMASPTFKESATPAMETFRESVHTTTSRVDSALVTRPFHFDAFRPPFFQGEAAFAASMREVVEVLEAHAKKLHSEIDQILLKSTDALNEVAGISRRLRTAIVAEWAARQKAIGVEVRPAVSALLRAMLEFVTQNHYLYDKYVEREMFPQPVIDAIEQQLGIVHRVDGTLIFSNKAPKNFAATVVSSAVKKARVEIAGQQQSSSVAEHCTQRVQRAVKAHCAVEAKNVIDNVLKAVRDVAVKELADFLDVTLLTSASIRSGAVEDADIEQHRCELRGEIESMQGVLSEIASLDPPPPPAAPPIAATPVAATPVAVAAAPIASAP